MRKFFLSVLCLMSLMSFSRAAEIIPLQGSLAPAMSKEVVLTLSSGDKSFALTLADIERLPVQQTTLKTPWGLSGTFQGVLVRDLMAAYQLKASKRIVLGALDNYVAGISKGELDGSPAFFATRFNGKPIALENRGPLILLWPGKDEAALQGKATASSWTWSIKTMAVH